MIDIETQKKLAAYRNSLIANAERHEERMESFSERGLTDRAKTAEKRMDDYLKELAGLEKALHIMGYYFKNDSSLIER